MPKQEIGRLSYKELTLSRANKSVRVFDHVVERLSNGHQPDLNLLEKVGKEVGEPVWNMPIDSSYEKDISSDIADMKNVGSGRGAGSTAGAIFVKRFIKNVNWIVLICVLQEKGNEILKIVLHVPATRSRQQSPIAVFWSWDHSNNAF